MRCWREYPANPAPAGHALHSFSPPVGVQLPHPPPDPAGRADWTRAFLCAEPDWPALAAQLGDSTAAVRHADGTMGHPAAHVQQRREFSLRVAAQDLAACSAGNLLV